MFLKIFVEIIVFLIAGSLGLAALHRMIFGPQVTVEKVGASSSRYGYSKEYTFRCILITASFRIYQCFVVQNLRYRYIDTIETGTVELNIIYLCLLI